jgi:hypothetical protein
MEAGTVKHLGICKNGEFKPYKPGLLKSDLLRNDGKPMYLCLLPYREEKSTDQLGYLHGGIIEGACIHTEMFGGWTHDEIYNYFLSKFAQYDVHKESSDGTIIEFPVREQIRDFSKKRMSKFIEDVIAFLAINDIYVLSPDEYIIGKYKEVKQKKVKNA